MTSCLLGGLGSRLLLAVALIAAMGAIFLWATAVS